jgi:hypothetical protein
MMMKFKATVGALILVGCGLGYTQFAAAQACSGFTGTIDPSATTPDVLNGNNCTNNAAFTKICANSETLGGGGMDVYQLTLGAGNNNVQFTVTSAAFTPELAVTVPGGACSSSTACDIDQTIAAPGTVGPFGFSTNPVAAGNYFIFVANVTDAACGAYALTISGTLPVKLQNFSIN